MHIIYYVSYSSFVRSWRKLNWCQLNFLQLLTILSMYLILNLYPAIVLFMLSLFLWCTNVVCGHFEWKINRFIPTTDLCLSLPGLGFKTPYGVVSFVVFYHHDLRWKLVVRFVDVGGVVDHHCLNFLLIYSNKVAFKFVH